MSISGRQLDVALLLFTVPQVCVPGVRVVVLDVAREEQHHAGIDKQSDIRWHGERSAEEGIVAAAAHREFNGLAGSSATVQSRLDARAVGIGHRGIDRRWNVVVHHR